MRYIFEEKKIVLKNNWTCEEGRNFMKKQMDICFAYTLLLLLYINLFCFFVIISDSLPVLFAFTMF